jgi:hypothetical protein
MMMMTYKLKGSFGSEVRVILKETFPPFDIFTTNKNSHATPTIFAPVRRILVNQHSAIDLTGGNTIYAYMQWLGILILVKMLGALLLPGNFTKLKRMWWLLAKSTVLRLLYSMAVEGVLVVAEAQLIWLFSPSRLAL